MHSNPVRIRSFERRNELFRARLIRCRYCRPNKVDNGKRRPRTDSYKKYWR